MLTVIFVVAGSFYLIRAGDGSSKREIKRETAEEALLQKVAELRDIGRKIEKRSAFLQCQASMCPRNGPGGGTGGPGTSGGGGNQNPSCQSLGGAKITFDDSNCVDIVESSVTTFDNSTGNFTDDGTSITECSQEDLEKSAILYVTRRGCERMKAIPRYLRYIACNGPPSQGTFGAGNASEDMQSHTMKRSVFPPDERKLVINPKQTFPWSAIARISNGCTGTFIGPRHVLTAGHCVYNHTSQHWYSQLDIWIHMQLLWTQLQGMSFP